MCRLGEDDDMKMTKLHPSIYITHFSKCVCVRVCSLYIITSYHL